MNKQVCIYYRNKVVFYPIRLRLSGTYVFLHIISEGRSLVPHSILIWFYPISPKNEVLLAKNIDLAKAVHPRVPVHLYRQDQNRVAMKISSFFSTEKQCFTVS